MELNAFALHLDLLADTFLITFSETLLEELSGGPKELEREEKKTRKEKNENKEIKREKDVKRVRELEQLTKTDREKE